LGHEENPETDGAAFRAASLALSQYIPSTRGLQSVIEEAHDFYENHCEHDPPIETNELLHIAKNVWNYTVSGKNRFGRPGYFATIDDTEFLLKDGDAYLLFVYLKTHQHPRSRFWIANGLATSFGWSLRRLVAARNRLLALKHVEESRPATSQYGPALYRWIQK
jgi:hypothetical protein